MGNIGIQMAGFLNQNSPFRACFRKVFFASGRKKVLQQIPPKPDIGSTQDLTYDETPIVGTSLGLR